MTEAQVIAIFLLAGVKVEGLRQIENQYWPPSYKEQRAASPWWVVGTCIGPVIIGWRKRVICIDWNSTPFRGLVTQHALSKTETSVHASNFSWAVQYLTQWREQAIGEAQ